MCEKKCICCTCWNLIPLRFSPAFLLHGWNGHRVLLVFLTGGNEVRDGRRWMETLIGEGNWGSRRPLRMVASRHFVASTFGWGRGAQQRLTGGGGPHPKEATCHIPVSPQQVLSTARLIYHQTGNLYIPTVFNHSSWNILVLFIKIIFTKYITCLNFEMQAP